MANAQRLPERGEIPREHRWKLSHLFKSDRAWERERQAILAALPEIAAYRGRLREGPETVAACLAGYYELRRRLAKLRTYAARKADEDTRNPRYQAMRERARKAANEAATATAFIDAELARLPAKRLAALAQDPRLADYRRHLERVLAQKPHVLSPKEEALLARASLLASAGYNAYSAFNGADVRFPDVIDARGRKRPLNQALFPRYRRSPHREVRRDAFEKVFGTYARYGNTLAALLGAQVDANVTFARLRRYESALHAAMEPDELPVTIYETMVAAVRAELPTLHRYLRLRRRLLGLRTLAYHDLYAPLVPRLRLVFPYDQARALITAACAPLGETYVKELARGLSPRAGWVDPFPNKGKRSGAYMDGSAYDAHPYVLANYIDDYGSLVTMAHEMGHAMHSLLSNRRQPYPLSDYSIFVAEVASTVNEALLAKHLIDNARSKKRRLFFLVEQLERFRQTFFRQAMFAEFELAIYRRAEAGEALTAELLTRQYLATARAYYGHDDGVTRVDDRYGYEWAYVPHFYYHFYVYQYVTGITAATALAERIMAEGAPARDAYLEHVLSAGCSAPPAELLRRAGVDLERREPYAAAGTAFARSLAEVEDLVGAA